MDYIFTILAHFPQMWMSVRKDWTTAVVRCHATLPQLAGKCADRWLCVSTPMAATSAPAPLAIQEMGPTVLVGHQYLGYQIAVVFTCLSDFKAKVVIFF